MNEAAETRAREIPTRLITVPPPLAGLCQFGVEQFSGRNGVLIEEGSVDDHPSVC